MSTNLMPLNRRKFCDFASAGLGLIAIIMLLNTAVFVSRAERAEATVVERSKFRYAVEFQSSANQPVRAEMILPRVRSSERRVIQVGYVMSILYHPTKVTQVRRNRFADLWSLPLLWGLLAFMIQGLGRTLPAAR